MIWIALQLSERKLVQNDSNDVECHRKHLQESVNVVGGYKNGRRKEEKGIVLHD